MGMTYTDMDCIEALWEAARILDASPGANDYRDLDLSPSAKTIADRFGTWNKAKEVAGLEVVERGKNGVSEEHRRALMDAHSNPVPTYRVGMDGYPRWYHTYRGELYRLRVHRLLAVAEYGFDEVCGKVVHHENGEKWANWHDNIDVMTDEEHGKLHATGSVAKSG